MLNYRNTNIVFLLGLLILLSVSYSQSIHILIYIIIGLFYLAISFYGSAFIGSNFHIKTICKGKEKHHEITITFDDGPVAEITPKVLDILKENDIHATFFCIGKRVGSNPEIAKRIIDEGHIIGNHTYSHSHGFDFFSSKKMTEELKKCDDAIEKVISKKPNFFRPPNGVTNPMLRRALKNFGYHVIGWSVRSFDTSIKDEKKVLKRITKKLKGGDIVLFHDSHTRIIPLLHDFLDFCNENGFKIVGLEEMINKDAYA